MISTSGQTKLYSRAGFMLDVVILGHTTAAAGLAGVPPPNSLLPQMPLFAAALLIKVRPTAGSSTVQPDGPSQAPAVANNGVGVATPPSSSAESDAEKGLEPDAPISEDAEARPPVAMRVLEQRWGGLLYGMMMAACSAPPLQRVLGLTPLSVLAGLFLFMAQQGLSTNPISRRFLSIMSAAVLWAISPLSQQLGRRSLLVEAFFRRRVRPALLHYRESYPLWLERYPYGWIAFYIAIQIVATAGTYALTYSPIAFMYVASFMLLAAFRPLGLPKVIPQRFRPKEYLQWLDQGTCGSDLPEDKVLPPLECIMHNREARLRRIGRDYQQDRLRAPQPKAS